MMLIETFDEHYDSDLYTIENLVLHHMLNNSQRVGTTYGLDGSEYGDSNVFIFSQNRTT